jgi:hypothetical protein
VTQLGTRLRVLIPERQEDPLSIVETALRDAKIDATATLSPASLEDVFVAVTTETGEQAA